MMSVQSIRIVPRDMQYEDNAISSDSALFLGDLLLIFEPVTDEFVLKIINSASAKSCELDPIPTTLLYENLDIL